MSQYFDSSEFRKDFNNLLKSIILISHKLENVVDQLASLNDNIEKLVEKSNTDK